MNLINRGVVGEWRHAGQKVLFGVVYLAIGVALVALLAYAWQNKLNGVGAVGVFLFMWVLALGDANLGYVASWVFDDVDIASP